MSSRATAAARIAEDLGHVGEAFGQALRGFEEDQRGADVLEFGQRRPALAGADGRKPANKKRSVGRPASASAVSAAEAPGMAWTGKALLRPPRAPA